MAFTTFLVTVSMVAIASAGFPGWQDNDNPFPGFPSPMMPSLRFSPLALPSMPGMPTFPPNFPAFKFPAFPAMPTMPSVADIAKTVPKNGGSFNGVVITSKSDMKRNEDGTCVKEDGTTIMTNTNGVISVKKIGSNPPDLNINPAPEENTTE